MHPSPADNVHLLFRLLPLRFSLFCLKICEPKIIEVNSLAIYMYFGEMQLLTSCREFLGIYAYFKESIQKASTRAGTPASRPVFVQSFPD